MSRSLAPLAFLGAAVALGAIPRPLVAQSLSATEMIEQLDPRSTTRAVPTPPDDTGAEPGDDMRGIRLPGEAGAAPSGPTNAPAHPRPPVATTARPDVPAVSITVQFATGSWSISPAAGRALAPLGQALSSPQLSAYRFRIEGHTDTVGNDAMNRDLSQRRAEAVRDYLVRTFRVPGGRLEAIGLGESQLLVPTPDETPEGRNRRVQVVNLGS